MDERLFRKYVKALLIEMSHYAPVKKDYAERFPHLTKGHASTLEETLDEVVEACRELGDTPFLFRVHNIKGKSSGVVVVNSDPEGWRRGRMGLTAKIDSKYESFMEDLTSKLGLTHVVYTSFGKGRYDFGTASIFVPISSYKAVWNPEVSDVYVKFKDRTESGATLEDVIAGYKTGWPSSAPSGIEVIVDVDKYVLVSREILSHTMFYRDKKGAEKLMQARTYSELADALSKKNT